MKLIILTQYFYPEMGAAASRLYELAKGMIARGWDVKVLAAMPNYPTGKIFPQYRRKLEIKEEIDGIEVRRYWLYASNSNKVLPRIANMTSFALSVMKSWRFLKKEKPDFILIESPPLLLGLPGILLSKISGARSILNVADLWPLSARELNAVNDGAFYRAIEKLEKFIYKKSDICLGQSEEIVTHLKGNGGKKVHLFRNGVDFSRFINLNGLDHNTEPRKKIVYAGLIGVAQGILNLCKRIDLDDKNVELHIYGEGAERRELVEFLHKNPGKKIFLHEPVKRENVPHLLSTYDGALIPLVKNLYGAVPSKIYEAMAAGLPIFFSGNGEGASIIRNMNVGWVSRPGDYASLQLNIDDFLADSEKRKKFHHNGKNAAKNYFNRETQIDSLHNLLIEEIR